jgi:hypothetical protein
MGGNNHAAENNAHKGPGHVSRDYLLLECNLVLVKPPKIQKVMRPTNVLCRAGACPASSKTKNRLHRQQPEGRRNYGSAKSQGEVRRKTGSRSTGTQFQVPGLAACTGD